MSCRLHGPSTGEAEVFLRPQRQLTLKGSDIQSVDVTKMNPGMLVAQRNTADLTTLRKLIILDLFFKAN